MNKTVHSFLHIAASGEIWIVGTCVAISVVLTWMLPIAIGVALLFWLVRWLAYGSPGTLTPAGWAFGILLCMLPVTLWVTEVPGVTQVQAYRLLTGVALFYAIVNWTTSRTRLMILVAGLIAVGIVLALIAPFSMVWSGGKFPFIPETIYAHLLSVLPFNIHSNVLAGYLVIVLPVPLALLLAVRQSSTWLVRLLLGLAILLMAGVLILTQSRGALIALTVTLATMVLLMWRWGKMVLIASTMLIGGIVISPMGDLFRSSMFWKSSEHRLIIWSYVFGLIQQHPFTGIGLGTLPHSYPLTISSFGPVVHAHNLFLQIVLDLGIAGLVAWGAIAFFVLGAAWGMYCSGQSIQDGWIRGIGIGLFGSQLALLVHGFLDCVTWVHVEPAAMIWGMWGIAIAGWNLTQAENL